LRFAELSLV